MINDGRTDNLKDAGDEPWLAANRILLKSADYDVIVASLQHLKDNHLPLILVAEGGAVYQQNLVINLADDRLQIDKPLEWVDGVGSCRVFFKDSDDKWNFFPASELAESPFNLSVAMPDELYFFQQRSCHRVTFPPGTRALVKRQNDSMATVFVHDLSAAGMLICNDPLDGEYDKDSVISDIVISIPARGGAIARRVLPLISRGQIVRSYTDQETMRPCHGVSFQYDSRYVEETIRLLVAEVERDT